MQWKIEVVPGQNKMLNGTIERAIKQAQRLNPDFIAHNDARLESTLKRAAARSNVAPAAPAVARAIDGDDWPGPDHPAFGCNLERSSRLPLCPNDWQKDVDCYSRHPWWYGCNAPAGSPGDGEVQCFYHYPVGANKTAAKYDSYTILERYPGPAPTVPAGKGKCLPVSCSSYSAVYLCNTREEPGSLPSWTHVAAGAYQVADKCTATRDRDTARDTFFQDFWAVQIDTSPCDW